MVPRNSDVFSSDGTSLAHISVLECVELLAPLAACLGPPGHVNLPRRPPTQWLAPDAMFTVGVSAFRKAARPRAMAAWGLEGIRAALHAGGAEVLRTVGTAAFRKAAGPRVMAALGLERDRERFHAREAEEGVKPPPRSHAADP